MRELQFALKLINIELLHEQIAVIVPPLQFGGVSTDESFIRIFVGGEVDEVAIAAAVADHDPVSKTQGQQDEEDKVTYTVDVRSRLDMAGLRDKTPAQIYTQLQNQIDAWADLADAKSDFREWLPLLAAAVVWLSSKD